MKIFKSFENSFFETINPMQSEVSEFGQAAVFFSSTEDCYEQIKTNSKIVYSWMIEYDFHPSHQFCLEDSTFIAEDLLFVKNKNLKIEELTSFLKDFDSIVFAHDLYDTRCFLLENCSRDQLELVSVILYSDNQKVVNSLRHLKLSFDGEFFQIPFDKITEVNELLKKI